MSKKRVKAGDVFQMSVDDDHVAYGQVVSTMKSPNMPMLAIFEPLFARDATPPLNEIVESPILFLVNSFIAKMEDGEWPVIGCVKPDLSRIPLPNFKIGRDDQIFVMSYDGKRKRKATAEEAKQLSYRNTVSENLLARAVRASHGLEPWNDDFERYGYQAALDASQITV